MPRDCSTNPVLTKTLHRIRSLDRRVRLPHRHGKRAFERTILRSDQEARPNARFVRMDAQQLALPDARFDVVLCSLGLMYLPDPGQALREMGRVLRPGGRLALSVWGERSRCGWAVLFEIVDAEVTSDVCPLFFGLGRQDALARLCGDLGPQQIRQQRLAATLVYADGAEACRAALVGGPVALAWSRFSEEARDRVHVGYLDGLSAWRWLQGARRIRHRHRHDARLSFRRARSGRTAG